MDKSKVGFVLVAGCMIGGAIIIIEQIYDHAVCACERNAAREQRDIYKFLYEMEKIKNKEENKNGSDSESI